MWYRYRVVKALLQVVVLAALLIGTLLATLASALTTTIAYDGILFTHPNYNYAPSAMFDGPTLKVWWCAYNSSSSGDAIFYSEHSNSGWSSPQIVMQKSDSGWDSTHNCDPSVVKGAFSYGGKTYAYAMYYGGTDECCANTRIGVAFSNDGKTWVKNSANPIISPVGGSIKGYGAGMPTAYRAADDKYPRIHLAYWDSTQGTNGTNYLTYSLDGQTFIDKIALPNPLYWEQMGDIAYNPSEGKWYVATKHANDQIIYLYKTANAELTSRWTAFGQITSALTGNLLNHNPGFVRRPNGDMYVDVKSGYKYIYFGSGTSKPTTWDLGKSHWIDRQEAVALNR